VPTTTSPCSVTYAFLALPPNGGGLARGFEDSGHLVTLPRPGSDANQLSAAYFEVFVVVVYYESRKRDQLKSRPALFFFSCLLQGLQADLFIMGREESKQQAKVRRRE
jgi:hypothetical protein